MKQYSRFITLAGGILALCSFRLPWEADYSGVEYANMSFNAIRVMFFASLVVIGISLALNRRELWKVGVSKVCVTISSGIALGCFVVLFFGESLEIQIDGYSFNEPKYGVFLNAIGFILAITGVWNCPKIADLLESNNEQDETNS